MRRLALKRSLILISTVWFLFSCALLAPPTLVIPTPIPTPPPLEQSEAVIESTTLEEALSNTEVVQDPISNVVPNVDPNIAALVSEVSEQQLIAYVKELDEFRTRNTYSISDSDEVGIGAARRWLVEEFVRVGQHSGGRMSVTTQPFFFSFSNLDSEQENVIATLAGIEPGSDVIVVMAHYDSRPNSALDGRSYSPGANDNGSGVALLLETARLLSARSWNQTIIFAAVAAEEQGTFGSKELVQMLIRDGYNVQAAINYDTVGGRNGIPQSIRLFAPDMKESASGEIARYYSYMGNLYVPTFPINMINALDREGRWGDQREFIFAGMPAMRLTESVEDPDMVNSPNDRWNAIDYNYLRKVTQLNVAVIANMAGAPPKPAPPTIVRTSTPGAFLLTWPRNPRAAGYAIAFRPIDSLAYPPMRFVNTNQAGNVVLTGFDPTETYMVSLATIDQSGRLSLFSPEIRIDPN